MANVGLGIFIFAAGLLAFTVAVVPAGAQPSARDKQVLNECGALLASPAQSPNAKGLADILQFAKETSEFTLYLYSQIAPEGSGPNDSLCYSYYIVGATQFHLMHPDSAGDKYADILPAIQAALFEYRAIRKRQPAYDNAHWDQMDSLDRRGLLQNWATRVKSILEGPPSTIPYQTT